MRLINPFANIFLEVKVFLFMLGLSKRATVDLSMYVAVDNVTVKLKWKEKKTNENKK
jgi:hypothetical protein